MDIVSISSQYFGEDVGLYYGTVSHVSSSHVQVTWDIDGGKSKHESDAEDLTLESADLPVQKPLPTTADDESTSIAEDGDDDESTVDFKRKTKFTLRIKPLSASLFEGSDDNNNNQDDDEKSSETRVSADDLLMEDEDVQNIINKMKKKRKRKPKVSKKDIQKAPTKKPARRPKKQDKRCDADTESAPNDEESNILDCSDDEPEDDIEDDAPGKPSKLDVQRKLWSDGGWSMDPCDRLTLPCRLHMNADVSTELDFIFHFLPKDHIREVVIPATNAFAKTYVPTWKPMDFPEFMHVLGLLYAMQVYEIHGNRRMYWDNGDGLFPSFNFGKIVGKSRFEDILYYLQLSHDEDPDAQILTFIEKVNRNFKTAISPGSFITLDESMVKSFHKDLKGKIKIIRKPRPIGNEFKTLSDSSTNIMLYIELYEGKELMADKEHVKDFGATTATSLRLTESYAGSGRKVVGDSWFGSVKCAIQLKKQGLYSMMLVKTAHKDFPLALLNEEVVVERGEWKAYKTKIDGVELQACQFKDLKMKDFISTCSTSLPGVPRKTKHHGNVSRPKVAEEYLNNAASVDIHNHLRTGSQGLEDAWRTQNPHRRQLAGILSFCLTNSYLAYNRFKKKASHFDFKWAASNQMAKFMLENNYSTRCVSDPTTLVVLHPVVKLPFSKICYYCQHGYDEPMHERNQTTYKCGTCNIPLHKSSCPSSRVCWNLHITKGVPQKRKFVKK